MSPLDLLFWIVVHGLAVAAVITWVYDTNLLAELSNVLPGQRPEMFLRSDFDEWLATTNIPGWIQALLTCGKCGTAHAAFWLTLPAGLLIVFNNCAWFTVISWLLLWLGSAGFSMVIKQQHNSK